MTSNDPTDPGWIDHSALRRLLEVVGNDKDELAELFGDYLEDAPDLARRMMEAAAEEKRDVYRIAAHTLKSNAKDFGAIRLGELCAEAESASLGECDFSELAARAQEIARAERAAREAIASILFEDLNRSADTN